MEKDKKELRPIITPYNPKAVIPREVWEHLWYLRQGDIEEEE